MQVCCYKKYRLLIALLISPALLQAQRTVTECGVITTPAIASAYDATLARKALREKTGAKETTIYYVRVFIHDFLNTGGSFPLGDSSWLRSEILQEFNIAADLFRPSNICLVLAGVDYPRNPAGYTNFNTDTDHPILEPMMHTSSIDIFLHNNLRNSRGGLNGISYAIPGTSISLSRGAIGNRSMAHELGHAIGLLHTFETYYGLECPDGSNSTSTGDKITDTRATPDNDNYLNNNTTGCVYSGNLTITCNGANRTYNPEITNIMCYGDRTCRSIFSFQQISLMHTTLENENSIMYNVWFPEVRNALLLSLPNQVFTYDKDTLIVGSPVQLGIANSSINLIMGGEAVQRVYTDAYITVKPGVKIAPSSGNSNRGIVTLSIGTICGPTPSIRKRE